MRNFEERKAEVIRRSRERIRQKKRKQKQLLVAAPLACMAVLAVVCLWRYLPLSMNSTAADCAAADNMAVIVAEDQMLWDSDDELPVEYEVGTYEETTVQASKSEAEDIAPTDWTAPDMGLRLTVEKVDAQEKALYVLWDNETDWTVTYNAAVTIERLAGEDWVDCTQEEANWDLVCYELQPWASTSECYDLSYVDISEPGIYRIVAVCWIDSEGEKAKNYLTAEFEIT